MKNGGQAHVRPVVGGEPCPGCEPHAAGGYGSAFVLVVLLFLFARAVPVWAAPPQITSATAFTMAEGRTAVTTLTATDPENDPLTWSIPTGGGADADAFSLTAAGVLTFTAAPDYEASTDDDEDNVYAVTVEVSDGTNATPAALEVTVADVAPGLAGPPTARHPEGKRGLRIAAYSVDDDVTWSLTGDDAAQFTIAGGFLRFVDPPDFENAADQRSDNVYDVTVQADDGAATETVAVAVTVTDIDEPGVVTLSPLKPKLGTALTATLADPDTVSGTTTWLWERNDGREGWETIDGATSASYTPTATDGDRYLRATATYTDGFGSGKTAQAMSPHVVIAYRLSSLSFTGLTGVSGDNRAFYPAFDRDTLHYAARCTESVTLTVNAEDGNTRLSVNGVQRSSGQAFTVAALDGESDIRIVLSGSDGASTTYTVHCIDREEFPKLSTVKSAGATEDLAMFRSTSLPSSSHLVMMDNNGVPRLRKLIRASLGFYFRAHPSETHPRARYSFTKHGSSGGEMVVLDKYFNVEDDGIRILSPFTDTDTHDQAVLPNGNYLLMAYSPTNRDLRFINAKFPEMRNEAGELLTSAERLEDGAIQIRTPGGTAVFNWNSWDHLAIENCLRSSKFSEDYAHINSLAWVDGDIIAGFRHCNNILRINGTTGDVIWHLGLSIYSRAEWEAGKTLQSNRGPAPLDFVNDPVLGFSGQHGGHYTRDGNLLVYDNNSHCTLPPGVPRETLEWPNCWVSTRAVEYAIDTANGEAVFQREFRLRELRQAGPSGHAEPMANGDWFVSWSITRGLSNSAVQVDAETDTEKLTVKVEQLVGAWVGEIYSVRVGTISPVALADVPLSLEASIVEIADFHTGTASSPTVVVAFNQPVVEDFADSTPSVAVTGVSTWSAAPYVEAGAPAHAYQFTLIPTGDDEITFALVADQPCDMGGICTAGEEPLSNAPADTIPGPVTVSFEAASADVSEGGTVDIRVELNRAHDRAADVAIPLAVSGTATRTADYTLPTSVTFGPTETIKTVTLAAVADLLVEGDESVEIGFGTLGGVSTGSPASKTVTVADATADSITLRAARTDVAEGNALDLTFSAGAGITFTTAQTITLTLSGTAQAADYMLSVGGITLSSPYILSLPVGANAVTARLTIVNDTLREGAETITVRAVRGTDDLGTVTLTIPASDTTLPKVTIHAATSGSPLEGTTLEFTLRRTGATDTALPVVVQVGESGTMLGTPPTTATFAENSATATLSVPTDDDQVVEAASVVTASVSTSSAYEVGVPQAASVTVSDNDTAQFAVSVLPAEITEGESAEVAVAITNGVTFATDQTISLALTGEATAGDDYTVAAETLTLPAGVSEVTTTLTTVDDTDEEGAELLTVTATHETTRIGSASLTIEASDVPPAISITAGSEVDEGAPVVFTLTREKVTEPNELPELTVAVTVTDTYGRLSAEPPATVTFGAGATTAELRLPTEDDDVILMDPATEVSLNGSVVTVRVDPDETSAPFAYTVVDGADTAQVMVTENDTAMFDLVLNTTAVTEGEEVTVTVSITNGVTFSASHTIPIFAQDTGTATLGNGNAPGGDYTVHAPQGNEGDHIRLRRNRNAASATIRVRDDARAEAAETIRLVVRHPGTGTDIGTAEITIAASDQVGRLQRAEVVGARLTLTFAERLDANRPPPVTAFEVKAGEASGPLSAQAIESVTVSDRTVVVVLKASVPTSHLVQVSYTDPTAGDDGAALQNTVGADAESWRDEPVSNTGPPTATATATAPAARRPGGGGAPADVSPVPEPVGYLENPGANSFQSGIGVLSGWVCEAEEVEIEIETESGAIMRLGAAYGTERLDTAGGCGDTDNGFGLLFNWNLLSDGEHEVVAFVDGIELGRATVTVTTLGAEFLRGVEGECVAEDFPTLGETVTLVWQQTSQNFVMAGGSPPAKANTGQPRGLPGFLENPGHNSFQSGVGVLSGWVCEAETVEITIGDFAPQAAAYGTERVDTAGVCGDTANGFGLLFNWNLLGDGEHDVVAFVDGEELGRATVQVTTLGQEFLRDVAGECVVDDFPALGQTVTLEWYQNSQNFVLQSYVPEETGL